MENPESWGAAERIVSEVLAGFRETAHKEKSAGLSVPRRVCDALRDAGLLVDYDLVVRGPAVHLRPPTGQHITPCCGYPPGGLPEGDRMTDVLGQVTCGIGGCHP